MRAKYNLYEISFYSILIILMTLSFSFALRDAVEIIVTTSTMFKYILCVLLPFVLYFLLGRKSLPIGGVVVAAAVAYLYQNGIAMRLISYTAGFIKWLNLYLTNQSYFEYQYTNIFIFMFILIITMLISVIMFILGRKAKVFLIIAGTSFIAYFWFIYVDKAKSYLMMFLFGSILSYSFQIYKDKAREWNNVGEVNSYSMGLLWVLNSGVIILSALIISSTLSINIKPIRWSWIDNVFTDVFPFIVEWRNDTLDSYSYGYSSRYNSKTAGFNDRILGGPLVLNKNIMFELSTGKTNTAIYLKGTVKDNYIANRWRKSDKDYKTYRGDENSDSEYSADTETRIIPYKITHRNLLTSTIFHPYSLINANYKWNKYNVDEDGEAYFNKIVKKGEEYTATALKPIMKDKGQLEIDRSSLCPKYTELPENISDRTKELSLNLTSNKNSDFDKIKAVEEYLRSNYRYTVSPSKVPSNKEFVDYFLFEGKEGYCTYFATSMAVLLRASGIPCRYVEGFIVTEDSWNGQQYIVKGTSAHAWVEVKFKDIGWINFEPTPAYLEPEYEIKTATEVRKSEETGQKSEADSTDINAVSSTKHKKSLEEYDEEDSEMIIIKKENNIKNYILYLILIMLLIWLSTWIYKLLKIREFDEGAKRLIKVLIFFSILGIDIRQNETIRQFSKRVKEYDGELIMSQKFINILEKSIYDNKGLSEIEINDIEIHMKNLKRMIIRKKGIIKYAISLLLTSKRYCKYI